MCRAASDVRELAGPVVNGLIGTLAFVKMSIAGPCAITSNEKIGSVKPCFRIGRIDFAAPASRAEMRIVRRVLPRTQTPVDHQALAGYVRRGVGHQKDTAA